MKQNRALVFAMFFALTLFLNACIPSTTRYQDPMTQAGREVFWYELPVREAAHGEDYVIEWQDRGMELAIRQLLEKPEGDIFHRDVWDIHTLSIVCFASQGTVSVLTSDDFSGPLATEYDPRSILNSVTYELTEDVPWISTLADLVHFDGLQKLILGDTNFVMDGTAYILDTSVLGRCANLEILSIGMVSASSIADIASCTGLRVLSLIQVESGSLEPLSALKNLEHLSFYHTDNLELTPLMHLPHLETLVMDDCNVVSLEPLAEVPGLQALSLDDGTTFPSLEPLTRTNLEYLSMDCWNLGPSSDRYSSLDYTPLSRIPTLVYLDLTNHRRVDADLCTAILENAPNLKYLRINQTAAARELEEPGGLIFFSNNL